MGDGDGLTGYRRGIEFAVFVILGVVTAVTVMVLAGLLGLAHSRAAMIPIMLLIFFLWFLAAGALGGHFERKRINSWDGQRWTYPTRWRA